MKAKLNKRIIGIFALFVSVFILAVPAFGQGDKTIKILAIGNSFSEDVTETHLYDVAKFCGKELIIGNLFIGGCSLETHRNNANNDSKAYTYRKIVNGLKTTQDSVSLAEIIPDEDWDYITFQQVSQNSGKMASYFPYLTELKKYVSSLVTNPEVEYAMHMTWAYASNSDHFGFANYSNNQTIMFDSIVNAVNATAQKIDIDIVIPAGTAIQNARASSMGDNLCRDGYHLTDKGRYIVACAWVEKLLGVSTVGCRYIPFEVSATEVEIMQTAAHNAVLNSLKITSTATDSQN